MKWKCNFGFHDWSKWERICYEIAIRKSFFGEFDFKNKGVVYYQKRFCKECGYIQEEKL